MKSEIDLDEGYSMNYLIPAFFIIGTGLILFMVHFVPAILMILLGTLLISAKTGVLISIENKIASDYKLILGKRFGKNFDLTKFNSVRLKYTNDATLMQSRGSSNVVRAKTYDIIISASDKRETLIHEFTDYQLAAKAFNCLVHELNYSGVDEVAERRAEAARKRPKGRRR